MEHENLPQPPLRKLSVHLCQVAVVIEINEPANLLIRRLQIEDHGLAEEAFEVHTTGARR